MKVRSAYHANPVSIEPWETLRAAARRMHEGGFSCLPVVSGADLFGIITERDLVEALAADEHPEAATVFSHMTESPQTVSLDDDCAEAATRMLSIGCRHLPVMEGRKLVGIISARDLLPLAVVGAAASGR